MLMPSRSLLSLAAAIAALAGVQTLRAQDTTWFTDATAKAGLTGVKGFRINIVDINHDNYPDLLLENGLSDRQKATRILLNRQKPGSTDPHERVFEDVTATSGIFASPTGDTSRVIDIATMADINNDGNPDLVTGTYFDRVENFAFPGDRDEVMLGNGTGKFVLVQNNGLHELGLVNTAGFTFLDYDRDGKLDLYVTTWFADKTNDLFEINYLMHGNGNGTFTDATTSAGLGDADWPEYGASSTDWDNDGLPDIFTSNYCRSGGNLWHNNGDGTFTDAADRANYSSQHMHGDVDGLGERDLCQWAAQPADFDNDGDMDLAQVLVHGGLDAGEGRTTITVNGGPSTGYHLDWDLTKLPRDAPRSVHLGDQDGWWLDMDNDGLQDFIVAQCVYDAAHDHTYLWHQNADHSFTDVTQECGLLWLKETHNTRPFDYDLDGDEDVLVELWRKNGTVVSDIALVENHIGDRNNYAMVKLVAPIGVNHDAIGARIMLTSGGVTQIREVQAGQGHFGAQAPLIKGFGLAKNATIDSIVVRWPSATVPNTVVMNPPINRLLVIDKNGLEPQSVQPAEAVRHLTVVPNPGHDRVRVVLPHVAHGGAVEIFNVIGERLQVFALAEGATGVDVPLEPYPIGLYLLRYIDGDGGVFEEQVVRR